MKTKPVPKAASDAPIEPDDYTTEKQLKALQVKAKALDDFIVTQETLVGLSATQFWEKYYADEAEFGFDKFMQSRGEKNVEVTPWKDVTDPAKATLLG